VARYWSINTATAAVPLSVHPSPIEVAAATAKPFIANKNTNENEKVISSAVNTVLLYQGGERQFNGMVDVYVKTIKSDGIVGLYRGFVISCVGIIVYRGCYFGFYDTLKPLLLGEKAGLFVSFMLGYGNSVTYYCCLDVTDKTVFR